MVVERHGLLLCESVPAVSPCFAVQAAGVPTVPGSDGLITSEEQAMRVAREVRATADRSPTLGGSTICYADAGSLGLGRQLPCGMLGLLHCIARPLRTLPMLTAEAIFRLEDIRRWPCSALTDSSRAKGCPALSTDRHACTSNHSLQAVQLC